MKPLFLPIALATSTLLTACMGSDSGSKKDSQVDAGLENNTKTQVVSTESHNIYVPSGMDDITIGDEYLNGHVFGAGSSLGDASSLLKESEETEEKKASIQAFAVSQETPKVISLGNRDLVSFAAARDASSMEKKAQDIIEKIEDVLSDFGTTSSIFKQNLASTNEIVTGYIFETDAETTATDIVNKILGGAALSPDADDNELDNPAASLEDELTSQKFEVFIGVLFVPSSDFEENISEENISEERMFAANVTTGTDKVVILGAVVPTELAPAYSGLSKGVASTSNIGAKGAAPTTTSETFTIPQETPKVDFLFVIDNSGSMSDDQDTISDAADTFFKTISGQTLDYRLATITTDSSELRDSSEDGGFTSSEDEFKLDVKPGTYGSATETGIYFAEEALKDASKGDDSTGTVIDEGYPRAGAALSIIMFTDEPDFYNDISSRNSGTTFDAADNLFIDRNYQVYGILNEYRSESRDDGYVDLINNTNGSYADIRNLQALERIMEQMALESSTASSPVKLTKTPISTSLQVTKNGSPVVKNADNGWQYNEGNKTLSFYGDASLSPNDDVKVNYLYMSEESE